MNIVFWNNAGGLQVSPNLNFQGPMVDHSIQWLDYELDDWGSTPDRGMDSFPLRHGV